MKLIVDGNNLGYMVNYAFDLSYQGKDVSILYGFISVIQKVIIKYKFDSVLVCWDSPLKSNFRREILPGYKAGRHGENEKDPDVKMQKQLEYARVYEQFDLLKNILPCFGISTLEYGGLEADDLIFWSALSTDGDVIIYSKDDDIYQAISSKCSVLRGDKLVTIDDLNILPGDYALYKCLMGDKSDNVPGIVGVGPKTSEKLVNGGRLSVNLMAKVIRFIMSGKQQKSTQVLDYVTAFESVDNYRESILDSLMHCVEYSGYRQAKAKKFLFDYGFASIIANGLEYFQGLQKFQCL